MAGIRIGNKTKGILAAIGAALSALFGGVVGHKLTPKQTVVETKPAQIVLSPDLLPAVQDAYKARQETARKAADVQTQAQRDFEAAKAAKAKTDAAFEAAKAKVQGK